jgi:magnesium-transporting ATPase (P-type)
LADADVVARVRPGTKVELVEAHRRAGRIVGMTGDGVNDAPALSRADVGVAIAGDAGTDVARQAADLVVTDGELDTIVTAIAAGRRIFRNLENVVAYLVAGNLSVIFLVAAGMVAIPELAVPLLPVQLLWVNLVTDGFPALALGVDRSTGDALDEPPRDPDRPLLDACGIIRLASWATVAAGAALGTVVAARHLGWSPREQRTQLLVTLLFLRPVLAYVARTRGATFARGWGQGRAVAVAVAASLALTVLAVVFPPLRSALGVTPLPAAGWLLALAGAAAFVVIVDILRVRLASGP